MRFKELSQLLDKNNIPDDVKMMSDSGWECDPTEMDCVWYNPSTNTIVFEQAFTKWSMYNANPDWILLTEITKETFLPMRSRGINRSQ